MKQQKHFYSHLLETSSVSLSLGEMDLEQKERVHLISLVEINLHHEIFDTVLSELSEEDKKTFLKHTATTDHKKIWDFLKEKTTDIENKIQKTIEDVVKELVLDIETAKKKA